MFSQVFPPRIYLFNQCDLLFPPPAFQLPFAAFGDIYIVILLVIYQPVAFIFFCEPFNLARLVLKSTRINKPSHACVKSTAPARHDVDPEFIEAAFAHVANSSMRLSLKLPVSAWAKDTSARSFDSSLVLAQD